MKFSPPPVKPITTADCIERAQAPAPALRRRMAAFLYEGVVLFGVLMVVGFIFAVSTDQRHALQYRFGLMATLFLVLALYFMMTMLGTGDPSTMLRLAEVGRSESDGYTVR